MADMDQVPGWNSALNQLEMSARRKVNPGPTAKKVAMLCFGAADLELAVGWAFKKGIQTAANPRAVLLEIGGRKSECMFFDVGITLAAGQRVLKAASVLTNMGQGNLSSKLISCLTKSGESLVVENLAIKIIENFDELGACDQVVMSPGCVEALSAIDPRLPATALLLLRSIKPDMEIKLTRSLEEVT